MYLTQLSSSIVFSHYHIKCVTPNDFSVQLNQCVQRRVQSFTCNEYNEYKLIKRDCFINISSNILKYLQRGTESVLLLVREEKNNTHFHSFLFGVHSRILFLCYFFVPGVCCQHTLNSGTVQSFWEQEIEISLNKVAPKED